MREGAACFEELKHIAIGSREECDAGKTSWMIVWWGKGGSTAPDEIGVRGFEIIDLEHHDSTVAFLRGSGLGSADRGSEVGGVKQFQAHEASLQFLYWLLSTSVREKTP